MSHRSPLHARAEAVTGARVCHRADGHDRPAPDAADTGCRFALSTRLFRGSLKARMSRAAVFLDRDGTLIEEHGYLVRLDMLSLFPWSADAIRLLNRAGFATVVVTNQAAVARGMIDE